RQPSLRPPGRAAALSALPPPAPPGVPPCRYKGPQRARLRDAGLPGPRFAVACSAAGAAGAVVAAARIGLPVVVKPVAGSGSIGGRRCAELTEGESAARAVLHAGPPGRAPPAQGAGPAAACPRGAEYSVA